MLRIHEGKLQLGVPFNLFQREFHFSGTASYTPLPKSDTASGDTRSVALGPCLEYIDAWDMKEITYPEGAWGSLNAIEEYITIVTTSCY